MLDRRIIGKSFPAALNEVERGAIRRFAEALGDANPLHRDEDAARAAGYRSVLAPPTFPITFEGGFDLREALGLGGRGLLVGEQSFEFHVPICAGDRLWVTRRVVDVYEKAGPGGSMDFVVLEDEGRDDQGTLHYRARRTLVVRPPVKPAEAPAGAPSAGK